MLCLNLFFLWQLIFVFGNISENSVKFFLYNKNYRNDSVEITDKNRNELRIKVQQPVKILCHGIIVNSSVEWYRSIIRAYMNTDYNIVAVDWASYSFSGYIKAVSVTHEIAVLMGKLIIHLSETFNITYNDIHIIGHSLGAHIAGFCGKYVFKEKTRSIGRITGLDPAGPLFNYISKHKRLSKEDAAFVDIIHTNMGVLGISSPIGHMDFYPNGGVYQNKCQSSEFQCDHMIAPQYFAESIGNTRFVAVLCDSYINFEHGYCKNNSKSIMGDKCRFTVTGSYFLNIIA